MLGMARVWPPEIPMVCGLWVQLLIKRRSASETVFYKVKAFNFTLKLLAVLSRQLT